MSAYKTYCFCSSSILIFPDDRFDMVFFSKDFITYFGKIFYFIIIYTYKNKSII